MRKIHVDDIVATLRQLCIDANIEIRPDRVEAYHRALEQEESETGREVLQQLILNAEAAKEQRIPFCQDTGYAVVCVELGQNVHITGGSFVDALNEGVRQGYQQGFLRKSIVHNVLERINTGDNTPAPPGRIIGSAGPTTASRMDPFTPMLIERGLKGMIGKGRRSERVGQTAMEHGCVYFGSVEGTAALLSGCIQHAEVVAVEDLGPEAIYRLTVTDFPAIGVNDLHGRDLYEEGRNLYRRLRAG